MVFVHGAANGRLGGPCHLDVDVVVVVVTVAVVDILPVLVARRGIVVNMGLATGIQRWVAEQNVSATGPIDGCIADEGLPLSIHDLEGYLGVTGSTVQPPIGNDEETNLARVEAMKGDRVSLSQAAGVAPDDLTANRLTIGAFDVIAVAVEVRGITALIRDGQAVFDPVFHQHGHIVFHIDHEAARVEAAWHRVTIVVGGDQQLGEVQREILVAQQLAVISILAWMIDRPRQGEDIPTIAGHHQREYRHATRCRCQGARAAIVRDLDGIDQRLLTRSQGQCLQIAQCLRVGTQLEATAPISPEVDQRIQCPRVANQLMGLRRQVAGLGVTDIRQGILVHQASDDRTLTLDQFRTVVVDQNAQTAACRGAVTVGDGVVEQIEDVVLVAFTQGRRGMVQRSEELELISTGQQVGDQHLEHHRLSGKGGQEETVGADLIGQRYTTRRDTQIRQTGSRPGEGARPVRPEAVAQNSGDQRRLAIQIVHSAHDAVRQAILVHRIGGCATRGNAIYRRHGIVGSDGFTLRKLRSTG